MLDAVDCVGDESLTIENEKLPPVKLGEPVVNVLKVRSPCQLLTTKRALNPLSKAKDVFRADFFFPP